MKNKTSYRTKLLAAVIALFLIVLNGGLSVLGLFHKTEVYASSIPEEVTLSNSDFTGPTNGDYPRTPSNWTKVGTDAGNIVSGIISLDQTSFEANMEDEYYLGYKPYSYESMPDNYILFINAKDAASDYGYKSNSISLSSNSYYTISVMAYSARSAGTIGTVKLSGSDIENNNADAKITINPNGNWTEYVFFVETNAINSTSVNLELWLGEENLIQSTGAIFYDTVSIYKLSSDNYYSKVNNAQPAKSSVVSFRDADVASVTNPSFESDLTGWTLTAAKNSTISGGSLVTGVFNVDDAFSSTLTQVAVNPTANDITNNHKALLINNLESGAFYYTSSEFTIAQHALYRLSVWAYTGTLDGTAQIVLKPSGTDEDVLSYTMESISTSSEWTEYSFYITGNVYEDTTVSLQLWLGSEDAAATGYVFFDNIAMQKITSASFSSGSSGSNVKAASFDSSTNPTLSNGAMNYVTVEDTDDTYPYTPKNWTLTSTESNSTKNGIINTSKDLSALGITNPGAVQYGAVNNNILMLGNVGANYQYYTSVANTLSANSYYKISVAVQTQNLVSDYASIRLVNSDGVILASIDGIATDSWTTYTFLIKTGYNTQSVSVQLGLGAETQGTGYAFFDNARQVTSTEAEYASALANSKLVNLANIDFTDVSSNETNGLYTPYDFEANNTSGADTNYIDAGVLDTNNFAYPNINFPSMQNPLSPTGTSGYVLMIHSGEDANYSFTSKKSFAISSGAYYKVTVWVKTTGLGQDESNQVQSNSSETDPEYYPYGATVSLNNITASFSGIDTDGVYEQYTFYINCTTSATISVTLGLGNSNALTKGYVFFSDFKLTSIEETDYQTGIAVLEEDDAPTNILAVGSTDTEEEEETPTTENTSFDWLVIPTLITAVAIIVAVIGYFIRKIDFKRPVKVGISEYDREKTLKIEQEHREAIRAREERLQQLKQQLETVRQDMTASKKTYRQSVSRVKVAQAVKASVAERGMVFEKDLQILADAKVKLSNTELSTLTEAQTILSNNQLQTLTNAIIKLSDNQLQVLAEEKAKLSEQDLITFTEAKTKLSNDELQIITKAKEKLSDKKLQTLANAKQKLSDNELRILTKEKSKSFAKELQTFKAQKRAEFKKEKQLAYALKRDQLIAQYNALNAEIDAIYQEELRLMKEYKEYRRQVRIKRQELLQAKRAKKANKTK